MTQKRLEKLWETPEKASFRDIIEGTIELCDKIGNEGISDFTEMAGMLRHIVDTQLGQMDIRWEMMKQHLVSEEDTEKDEAIRRSYRNILAYMNGVETSAKETQGRQIHV